MTLPLPTPPTDNLYKFMALASAIVAVFFFYLAFDRVYKMRQSNWEITAQLRHIKTMQAVLPEQREIGSDNDEIDVKRFLEISKMISQLEVDLAILTESISNAKISSGVLIILSGLFALLSYYGFRLWYLRVQKLLDSLLLKQVSDLEQTETDG